MSVTTPAPASAPPMTAAMIAALHPDDLADPAAAEPFRSLSDAELTDAVARVISHPKAEAADSFILHAPLELMARSALLAGYQVHVPKPVDPGDLLAVVASLAGRTGTN